MNDSVIIKNRFLNETADTVQRYKDLKNILEPQIVKYQKDSDCLHEADAAEIKQITEANKKVYLSLCDAINELEELVSVPNAA